MAKMLKMVRTSTENKKTPRPIQGHREQKLSIGISDKNREGAIKILNTVLSDEFVLYTTTRNIHWNVAGPQFNDLHKFFDAQYQELNLIVDDVAERVRTLGGRAIGTLAEFLQHARLKERTGPYAGAQDMTATLLSEHETLIRHLRDDADTCDEKYKDAGTNDFLVGLMTQHEKMAWMLRSFLEGSSV